MSGSCEVFYIMGLLTGGLVVAAIYEIVDA
jgi:hypothetical protein